MVLKTNPSISFFSCPKCNEGKRDGLPECMPPPHGSCIPLDTSLNSVFEVRSDVSKTVLRCDNCALLNFVELIILVLQVRASPTDSDMQVNNLILHEVTNTADEDRVHLVIDVLEHKAPERVVLQPGQRCHYISTMSSGNTPGC